MRFSNELHAWSELDGFKQISKVNFMKTYDDNKVYIMDKEEKCIKKIKISYSNYKITCIYKETQSNT